MFKLSSRLLPLLAASFMQAAWANGNFLEPVADGVYMHRGQMADLNDAGRGDSANLGVVVGSRCVAVIDTGGSIATGQALLAAVRQLTDTPVCYVINTHVHFDHVLGNRAFVAPGTEFIGQANLPESIDASRDFFAESFAAELGGPQRGDEVVAPGRVVQDVLQLDLGDRSLRLEAVAVAHTATDLTVLDEKTNTLFSGDLVFRERLPILDGSLKGWLKWLAAARMQSYAHVVPGHGPVDNAWPAGAQALQIYLEALLQDTRAAIAKGVFIEDAKDSVAKAAVAAWQLTGRAHPLNISRAFRELEWE